MEYRIEEVELENQSVWAFIREDGRYITFEAIERLFNLADISEELLDSVLDLVDTILENAYGEGIPS